MYRYLFVLTISIFMLLSCQQEEVPIFEMELEVDFTIPAGLNSILLHGFEIKSIPTFIEAYTSDTSTISRIHASDAILGGRFGEIDYSIVNSIAIWAISPSDPNNRKEVFYQDFIELDHRGSLPLFSSLSEVKDLLTNDKVDLEIQLFFRTFTSRELESRISMNFKAYGKQ